MLRMSNNQSGFSIAELAVAISIASVVVVGLFAVLFRFTTTGGDAMTSIKQAQTAESARSSLETDVSNAKGFLATTDIEDKDPANNNWSHAGDSETSRTLILRETLTTTHPSNTARDVVYLAAGGCPIGTQPATYNVVYYLKSDTLYRRVVVANEPSSTYCDGQSPYEKRTCLDPDDSSAPSNCSHKDVVVARNVKSFAVDYYNSPTAADPNEAIYTDDSPQPALDATSTLRIQLTLQKGANTDEYTTQLRLARSLRL